jgi:hypothetical protein
MKSVTENIENDKEKKTTIKETNKRKRRTARRIGRRRKHTGLQSNFMNLLNMGIISKTRTPRSF